MNQSWQETNNSIWASGLLFNNDQVSLVLTFLERGTMLLGRTSLRFLQLSTGRVRAATQVPSVDEETRLSRCFFCNCSSASEMSPGMWSAKIGWRLYKGREEYSLLRRQGNKASYTGSTSSVYNVHRHKYSACHFKCKCVQCLCLFLRLLVDINIMSEKCKSVSDKLRFQVIKFSSTTETQIKKIEKIATGKKMINPANVNELSENQFFCKIRLLGMGTHCSLAEGFLQLS